MTIDELRAELQRRQVPELAYSIGRDENETYCLIQEPDGWHVYYSERGNRNAEKVLAESAACDELFSRLLNDRAVREWMNEHNA
ncbi:hypothetical protein [Promicromonospora sp. MEB111]|uniref:hypothetical protein n=1 Tax=Promicromonospora sp. MEB111 TaxID=3040301 RepID=UPI00254BBA18|nr:hypothetical protein [Promicromonospora sp. MEB111]